MLKSKDLLGLRDITAEEITLILDTAEDMKRALSKGKKSFDLLKGKTLVTLFYENSTRTRSSFELAGKYLGATEINIAASSSSVQKGETLIDTGKTLQALKTDFIAIRHPMGGAPNLLAKTVGCSVLNGGDGMNEHPTQALLDMLSIRGEFGTLKGLKVAILGDIKHSRVAKSNLFGLTKMGAEVWVYAPKTLIPKGFDELGAHIATSREECVEGAHAVMGLRIQLERQSGGLFPSRVLALLRRKRRRNEVRRQEGDNRSPGARKPRGGAYPAAYRRRNQPHRGSGYKRTFRANGGA